MRFLHLPCFLILTQCHLQAEQIPVVPKKGNPASNLLASMAKEKVKQKCDIYKKYRYEKEESLTFGFPSEFTSSLVCQEIDGTQRLRRGTDESASNGRLKEFPHMASIGYGQNEDNIEWACAGSLISEQFILSTATCIQILDKGNATWARLGEVNIKDSGDDQNAITYKIIETHGHPAYRKHEFYNDLALFKLSVPVNFTLYIRPICLFTDDMSLPQSNKTYLTGWTTGTVIGDTSDILQKEVISIISDEICEKSYEGTNGFRDGYYPETIMCGKSDKDKTCQGQPGSPLQIIMEDTKCIFLQVGITPSLCFSEGPADIFTKVSHYIPWIYKVVWANEEEMIRENV